MKSIKLFVAVLVMALCANMSFAQNMKVQGTVSDANGDPIIGASVVLEGTQVFASTDLSGKFSISAPADGVLVVSFIGFETQNVPVNGRAQVNVTLTESAVALDDVTVVAYGAKRKQDLVGSVTKVKNDVIANSQAASVSSALEGAVAGLQVVSSSGQPGDDASIYVRGIGSLSASNAALIVVDGTPFNGKLSDINPADIESISVSKDAVSNSLYGSRAAGGVVMVTTKKGSKDRINIQFSGNWGITQRAYKDYDMVTDPGEFYRLTWYGMRNTEWKANGGDLAAAALVASEGLLDELGNYNAFIIPNGEYLVNTDGTLNASARKRYDDSFADAMFKDTFRQEYVVSASGGSEKTDYYISMGFLDNESYIIGSNYNRLTTRVNVNSQLKKWVKVGSNINFSKTEQNGVQEGTGLASNPFSTARSWAPIFPVHAYDAEGNMIYDEFGKPVYDAGTGQTVGSTNRPTAQNQNVICNLYEDIRQSKYNNLTTRSYVEVRFLKNFTATVNYSYDYTNGRGTTYYTPTIGDGQSFGGRGTHESMNRTTTNLNQIIAYNNTFGDHNVSAKIGHEYYKYEYDYLSGQKTQFFVPDNPQLDNGGQMESLSSYTSKHNIEGYFAMADYNYKNKYYLSGAFRRDGTSRFIEKWGNFWSVGAAWRITQESFMEGASEWLNELKIRASYGTQGNESMLNYAPYEDQYAITWDGSKLGYSYSFYGNPDLTWEKQNTLDIGLEFKFLNSISGSVEYFNRTTDDMIFQRPLAYSTGGRPYNWENIGKMRTTGIEFEVNFDIFKKKDFRWSVGVVGQHYDNEILTLPEENKEDGITNGAFKMMEGHSYFEYFTYKYAGMTEDGDPQWYMDELDEEGNVIGQTITKNYSEATKYWLGKEAMPDLQGGLNTQLSWKGIDLSIATAFQIGGYGYDSEFLSGMSSSFYVGHHKELWNTYNPETGKGKYPIWNANNSSNSWSQRSDYTLVDASYFSIRNITLGYTFPAKWMNTIGIQKARVFVTADNLAMWSKRQGYDPRVSLTGSDSSFGGYAPLRVISGGINIVF